MFILANGIVEWKYVLSKAKPTSRKQRPLKSQLSRRYGTLKWKISGFLSSDSAGSVWSYISAYIVDCPK